MLVDKVYKAVQLIAAKDFTGGYISPADYNKAAELAQMDIVTEKYGSVQTFAYGQSYAGDKTFDPLKTDTNLILSSGLVAIPSDYLYFSTAHGYIISNGSGKSVPIDYVNDLEWVERNGSYIDSPDIFNPIMRQVGSNFEVAPQDITQMRMTYIKVPLIPWWNYTSSSNVLTFVTSGGETTNPNSGVTAGDSTDFTLSDTEFFVLTAKILKYLGIEIRDGELYQLVDNEVNKDK